MDVNNFNSSGRQSRGRSRPMNRGRQSSGRRGGQFDRKRHRPRSPVDLMYHRPRFDAYNPHDSFQPPFDNFDMPHDGSYYPPPHHGGFDHHAHESNSYGRNPPPNRNPYPEEDFTEEMSMDPSQHRSSNYAKNGNARGRGGFSRGGSSRGSTRGNFSRGGPSRGSTRGNFSRGGASRGSNRGNFSNTGNRGGSNRGTRTNFDQRGGGRGNQGGHVQRGKPRGQSSFHMQPDGQAVHSLAKLAMPDPTSMSIAEKIKRFGLYLKSIEPKSNSIQTISNALSASKLLMTAEYDSSVLLLFAGRPMFTGCLHIGGKFIVRAVGPTKKELKHDVYNQGLQILTTETVQSILSRVDRPEELKQTLLENLQSGVPEEATQASPQNVFEAAVGPLIKTLKTLLPAENSISVLEQARSMSKCPYKSYCTFDECDAGKKYFRSSYWLENNLIAIGHGKKKKESKHCAYNNAIKALTTKSIEELESGKNVEGSASETEWLEFSTKLPAESQTKSPGKDKSLELTPEKEVSFNLQNQLTKLVDQLKEYIFKLNNVHTIDCLAVKLSLSPVCVYKKLTFGENEAPVYSCDLYINDIFIASSAESNNKKDAQLQTYQKAWEFLTTTPVDSIVSEQPRQPDISTTDPSIIDVVRKGAGKYGDSNIERLGRYLINVYENWKSVDEMIIMEHIDWIPDRERHAFGILSQSATLSGLLMEWKITKDEEIPRLYKCSMFLQKEELAIGKDPTKNGARNKASVKALDKFYQTHPIIQVLRKDETKSVHLWEDIKKRAKTWMSTQQDMVPLDDSGEPTSEHVVNYCKHLMKLKLEEDTLEGVIFQGGMTAPETRAIKQHAVTLKMKSDTQQMMGQTDLIFSKKLAPDAMVKCLQQNQNKSGRYVLLTDQQRPHLLLNSQPATDSGENLTPTVNCVDVVGIIDDSQ